MSHHKKFVDVGRLEAETELPDKYKRPDQIGSKNEQRHVHNRGLNKNTDLEYDDPATTVRILSENDLDPKARQRSQFDDPEKDHPATRINFGKPADDNQAHAGFDSLPPKQARAVAKQVRTFTNPGNK